MKKLIIFAIIVGCALGEKSGPYPPRGWKPQGERFELPPSRQYGVPQDANKVEITTTINEYVPPPAIARNQDDFLQVQGLPAENSFSQFRNFQQQQQQQLAQSQSRPNGHPFLLSPAFAPQFASQNEQLLREQSFPNNNNNLQIGENGDIFRYKLQDKILIFINFTVLSRQYGPPTEAPQFPQQPPRDVAVDDSSEEDSDEDSSDGQRPVIAIANAEAHANGNRKLLAATQQGQFGQYYILLPDSSLQKVRYATSQTDDDRTSNGFSAQLK
jgi:hypothetical protein